MSMLHADTTTTTGSAIIITMLMALFIICPIIAIVIGVRKSLSRSRRRRPSPLPSIPTPIPSPQHLPGHAFLYGLAYVGSGLIKRSFTPTTRLHASALVLRAQRSYTQQRQYAIIPVEEGWGEEEEVWRDEDTEDEEISLPPPPSPPTLPQDDLTLRIEQARTGEGLSVMPLGEIAAQRPHLLQELLPPYIARFALLWTRNGGNIGPRDRGKTKIGFVRDPQDTAEEHTLKFARREYEDLLDILSQRQFLAVIRHEGKEMGKNIHDGQDGYDIERWRAHVLSWLAERSTL